MPYINDINKTLKNLFIGVPLVVSYIHWASWLTNELGHTLIHNLLNSNVNEENPSLGDIIRNVLLDGLNFLNKK
jgi:hypothetical protein